jgi:ribosomal protein L11 methyltransferase
LTDIDYICLRFEGTAGMEDMQAALLPFEPLGFLEEDDSWYCYFPMIEWTERLRNPITDMLHERFPGTAPDVASLPHQNWNAAWEESIRPIAVSERFIIAPSWSKVEYPGTRIVLTIDPKMSFGTGYHATTRLMLRLLERVIGGNERVLDVGTGTGVLAIAAIKLGADSAIGVDTDEWSCDNANENAEANGAAGRVVFHHGSIEHAEGRFDVVLSNITKNDNARLLPSYERLLSENGLIILSGFYGSDSAELEQKSLGSGFTAIDRLDEDEWAAILLARSSGIRD